MLDKTPAMVGANLSGKIFMKTFDNEETGKDQVKWLNFNKKITQITAGPIMPQNSRDILIVASENFVIAYGTRSLCRCI